MESKPPSDAASEAETMQNNENFDFDNEFLLASEYAESRLPDGLMKMCEEMDVSVLPSSDSDAQDALEQMNNAIPSFAEPFEKFGNMTLNSYNDEFIKRDEDDEMNPPVLWDLDQPKSQVFVEEQYPPQEEFFGEQLPYQQQEDFFPEQQIQPSGLLPPVDPLFQSGPISPTTIFFQPYPEGYNGNNFNEDPAPRSRKMSTCKSYKAKVEKPYHCRATKAEMQSLTTEEKTERKKEQNKKNAKLCVQRKNEENGELEKFIEEKEGELRRAKAGNIRMKNRLEDTYGRIIYPELDNNSPFGIPDAFVMHNNQQIELAVQSPEILEVLEDVKQREIEYHSADKAYQDILNEDKSKYKSPGTYPSKKSRAKKFQELSKNRYDAIVLKWKILEESAKEEVLDLIGQELNEKMASMRQEDLVFNYRAPP